MFNGVAIQRQRYVNFAYLNTYYYQIGRHAHQFLESKAKVIVFQQQKAGEQAAAYQAKIKAQEAVRR